MFNRRIGFLTYDMEADFYNKLFNAKKPLDAEGLLDCYEVLRLQLQRKPLCNFMYIEAVLDAVNASDLSVLNTQDRARIKSLQDFYPERLIDNARLMYERIGTINVENEDPKFPRFYHQYDQYSDYELAVKADERFTFGSELAERLLTLRYVVRPIIKEANLFDAIISYLKVTQKDVDPGINDYQFEWNVVMPLLLTMSKFEKSTNDQEKIKLYMDAFEQLKKLTTCMYDMNTKVFGTDKFTKLPIMDAEQVQLNPSQSTPISMKM